MEVTHAGGGTMRDRSASMEYFNMTKRIRSGSISGRLRTASDLEECGLIDRTQKGMIKDLIISGDTGVNTALESYELGNAGHIQDLLRQGYLRRKSIDLLDGLDLDFLQVEGDEGRKNRASSLTSLVEFFPESFGADYTLNTTDPSALFVPDLKFDIQDTDIGADWSSLMPSRKFSMDDTLYFNAINDHVDMSSYTHLAESLMNEQKINKSNNTSRTKKNGGTGGSSATKPMSKEKNTDDHHYYSHSKHEGRGGGSILTLDAGHSTVRFHYTNPSSDSAPRGYIGAYSPEARRLRIERFIEKRNKRVWTKKVKYDVRKNFADSRIRVKGRFVKKEEEVNLRADPRDF